MFDQTFAYLWHMWVDLVSSLGLPWDKNTTAYFGLVVLFWAIGLGFKILVTRK